MKVFLPVLAVRQEWLLVRLWRGRRRVQPRVFLKTAEKVRFGTSSCFRAIQAKF
jgi:hypothetical protein